MLKLYKIAVFILFLSVSYALVPAMIKLFIYLYDNMMVKNLGAEQWRAMLNQAKGVSSLAVYRWVKQNFWGATIVVWVIFTLGLMMALPAMIKDGFFSS